jgi:hypothetical protein
VAFADSARKDSQPPATAPDPHMANYPHGAYVRMISIPESATYHSASNVPPVKVARVWRIADGNVCFNPVTERFERRLSCDTPLP